MPSCHQTVTTTLYALQVPMWASCGGRSSRAGFNGTDGSLCCPAGAQCNFYNEW
jgi:hypothetical protein